MWGGFQLFLGWFPRFVFVTAACADACVAVCFAAAVVAFADVADVAVFAVFAAVAVLALLLLEEVRFVRTEKVGYWYDSRIFFEKDNDEQ